MLTKTTTKIYINITYIVTFKNPNRATILLTFSKYLFIIFLYLNNRRNLANLANKNISSKGITDTISNVLFFKYFHFIDALKNRISTSTKNMIHIVLC